MKAEDLIRRFEAGERDFRGIEVGKQLLGLLKVDLRGANLSGARPDGTQTES